MSGKPTSAASLASAANIVLLFEALPDALARRKMIDQLEKAHARLLAREAGPDLDGEQRDTAQVATLAPMSREQAQAATNCGLGFAVPGARP